MDKLPTSFVFHIIFCEDSPIMNIKNNKYPIVVGPYSAKKISIPGDLDLIMSISYQFRLKDKDDLFIAIISPSDHVISTIPLGEILYSEDKQEFYKDDELIYGTLNIRSEQPLEIEESGVYIFSTRLNNVEISKAHLKIMEASGESQ